MDIWLGRCNKKVKCVYCDEEITVGEPEVFGKHWRRYPAEKAGDKPKQWTIKLHWHGQRKRDGQCCWLAQAMERFAKTPHVETRGRKSLSMPKDMQDERNAILRRRAKTMQQIRAEMDKPTEERNVNVLVRLGERLEGYKEEILPYGGVPKGWV